MGWECHRGPFWVAGCQAVPETGREETEGSQGRTQSTETRGLQDQAMFRWRPPPVVVP